MTSQTPKVVQVFAYGSNMLSSRIKARCPSARVVAKAALHGYDLRWHKRSQDGSGKCDVVASDQPGSIVYGVLCEVSNVDKDALDQAEGLEKGYAEKLVTVFVDGASRAASLYYATDVDASLRPYVWYKELVVAGAREHNLPRPYIERLQATDAQEDPDRERGEKNLGLARGQLAK